MEEAAAKLDEATENEGLSIEEVMKKNDAIMNKVKFQAFGKSKPITKKALNRRLEDRLRAAQGLDDEEKLKELRRKHYDDMEEEINKLKLAKYGRATSVFKMKEVVAGPKKSPQEPHAILDSDTDDLVVDNEVIKKVTLKHCLNTLENNVPEEEVEEIVKLVNKVHDKRMDESEDNNEDAEISMEEFEEVVEKMEKREKKELQFPYKRRRSFQGIYFQIM